MTRIAPKQFLRLTDLLVDFLANPCKETDRTLNEYQDAIHWPFHATQAQIDEWNAIYLIAERGDERVA